MREKVPGITDEQIADWLENRAQKIVSENETLYFYDVAGNYLYAHFDEMRKQNERGLDFDYRSVCLVEEQPEGPGPYATRCTTRGPNGSNPLETLPTTGVLKIRFPLPVETDSQRNVTVTNLSCPGYIVAGPVTTGAIGYVYYEIPAGAVNGNLVLSVDIAFTSYEQIFDDIDPALVGSTTRAIPIPALHRVRAQYRTYGCDPEESARDRRERDKPAPSGADDLLPYHRDLPLQPCPARFARAREPKVAESTHMFETGHGDCGTQSMLFCILPVARDPRPCYRGLPDGHSRGSRHPLLAETTSPATAGSRTTPPLPRRPTGSPSPTRSGRRSRITTPRTSILLASSSRRTSMPRWTRPCRKMPPSSG